MILINTFLGFLIAQLYDVLSRNKYTAASPVKFSLSFFLKDTWLKLAVSLTLSLNISLLVWLNIQDAASLVGQSWVSVNSLVYAFIGFAPELILQTLKRKYGFLQPETVAEYDRK